jgi:hypothetical protein
MEQLFNALTDVLKGLEPDRQAQEAVVIAAWGRCAGDSLSSRTRAIEFFEKRLVVAVKDDMWRRQMEDLSPKMIAKLNGALGEGSVRFIEFRVAPSSIARAARRKKKTDRDRVMDASLAEAALAIADEGLRQRFIEAAAGCLDG